MDQRKLARQMLTFGLTTIQKRGTHATGVAIIGADGQSSIFKRAVPANTFIASEPYNAFMDVQPADAMIALGHTRWATHANSGLDDATHPQWR